MATERESPPSRLAIASAITILVVGLAVMVAVIWGSLRKSALPEDLADVLGWIGQALATAAFLLSGALIVSRQPRNVIGWLLVIPGLVPVMSELILLWLAGLDPAPAQADPFIWLSIWFTSWSWILLIFPIFLILLTFPNGRLLSPRWRWVVILIGAMTITMLSLGAFAREMQVIIGDEVVLWSVPNPIGFLAESEKFDRFFFLVWNPALLVATIASVAAVVSRYRKGTAVEREQLKWPMWGVLFFGLVYGIGAVAAGLSGLLNIMFGLALAAIPISVAIAILKYRLYEIDRIVSRTVSYALVVGLSAGAFLGVVALMSSLLPEESSDLAVAGSTLVVAALFNPLRRRVQVGVDRRFNRQRYDAQLVMEGFAVSLRDRVDPEEVMDGWVGVVSSTMQPDAIGMWVRDEGEAPAVV